MQASTLTAFFPLVFSPDAVPPLIYLADVLALFLM